MPAFHCATPPRTHCPPPHSAAKSRICISHVASERLLDLQVGDYVVAANGACRGRCPPPCRVPHSTSPCGAGRSLAKLAFPEALSIIRASRRPVKLSLVRPMASAVSRFREADRGQLLRRIATLAKQIQVVHSQYQQTVQANAVVHGVRGDLHAKLSLLTDRRSALSRRLQRGFPQHYELLRLRRAVSQAQAERKAMGRAILDARSKRKEAQELVDTVAFARKGAAGELAALRERLATAAAAAAAVPPECHEARTPASSAEESPLLSALGLPQPAEAGLASGACGVAGWGQQAQEALSTLTSIRASLLGVAQQVLSILRSGPAVLQVCAFLERQVAAEVRSEGHEVPDEALFRVTSPTKRRVRASSGSSAAGDGDAGAWEGQASFEADLLGGGQYTSALESLYMPITLTGQALVEVRDVLSELRDTLTGKVASKMAAAARALRSLREEVPFLAGISLPAGASVEAAEAGSLEDHMWCEPVAPQDADKRLLRVAAGAAALQLRLLGRLVTQARMVLGLPLLQGQGGAHTPPMLDMPAPEEEDEASEVSPMASDSGSAAATPVPNGPQKRARPASSA